MAKTRCPMCGKDNPEELEVCQFCDARLKPLIASSPPPATPAPEDDATPGREDEGPLPPVKGVADEDGVPDWLDQLRNESVVEDTSPAQTGSLSLAEEEEVSSLKEGEDWMQRIRSLQEDGPPPEESADTLEHPASEEETVAELPDWLQNFEVETSKEEEPELPDWLRLEDDEVTQPEAVESAPPLESQPFPEEGTKELASGEQGLADRFTRPEPAEEPPEPAIVAEEETPTRKGLTDGDHLNVGEEDLPDWLGDLGVDELPSETLDMPEALEGDELPDWLKRMGTGELTLPEIEPAEEESPSTGEDEEIPSWLSHLGSVVTGAVDDEYAFDVEEEDFPLLDEDDIDQELLDVESLPEWLGEAEGEVSAEEGSAEPDLTPAELPGWLAALRPEEGGEIKAEPEEEFVESAGPLAGLRNVLAAEPEIAELKKPPAYSLKLQVSPSQQTQARLLEELISSEGEALPVPTPPLVSTQRVLRWLIAFLLFLLVGFVVVAGGGQVAVPFVAREAVATSKLISSLPERAPVLVAFDYEPGLAGEMNATAAAVVDHLMLKGARLTLVSTLPTGPAIAEFFIHRLQTRHGYQSGLDYVNLGYIPGGATGLQGFARTPKRILPRAFDGTHTPWASAPLNDVNLLSDFEMVVIITDNADTVRSWVEQVQPHIGDTPLITVISAQAEPLVRPYFGQGADAQVRGIISGIIGGVSYEVAIGQRNLGGSYWDAFSVSLILAVGVILLGGVLQVVQYLLLWSKAHRGEGK